MAPIAWMDPMTATVEIADLADETTLAGALQQLTGAIRRLDETIARVESEAQLRSRALELRLSDVDDRLRKTASESRLAEFRGDVLRETKLLHDKIDLLISQGRR